jgi:pimeloyl-ACP methyl ester carboxylesterase
MNFVTTSRGRFAYFESGTGPLVILLHGFPDTPHAFLPVMERLPGFHCVAPFLRGYAPSPLDGPFDGDSISADIASIGDALSPSRPYAIVGHDWGALIAYALAEKGRVSSMVTMSVPHPGSILADPSLGQLRRSWYVFYFQLGLSNKTVERDNFAFIDRLYKTWSPSLVANLTDVKNTLRESHPAPLGYYRAMPRQLGRKWPKIKVPTLYLVGAEDGCISPELGRDQHKFYDAPFAKEVIPRAGHFLQWERPEVIAELIRGWIGPQRDR